MESHTTMVAMIMEDRTLGILAAEGRTSKPKYGQTVSNHADKIMKVHDTVYMVCSGNSGLIKGLEHAVRIRRAGHPPPSMAELAAILRDELNLLVGNEPIAQNERPLAIHAYVMGTITDVKIQLFEILRLSPNSRSHSMRELHGTYYASGSGARGVYAYFSNLSREDIHVADMDGSNGAYFASEAVRNAIARDALSGGQMKVVSIRFGAITKREILKPDYPNRSNSTYSIDYDAGSEDVTSSGSSESDSDSDTSDSDSDTTTD